MRRLLLIILFLVGANSVFSQITNIERNHGVQYDKAKLKKPDIQKILENHKIHFTEYDTTRTEILIGNARMGGPVNHKGLGFDAVWAEDFWADSIGRQALYNFKLEIDNIENQVPKTYSQTLNLTNGIVSTFVEYSDNKVYESKVFFSKHNKNLLAIEVKNLSPDDSLKFTLKVPELKFRKTLISDGFRNDDQQKRLKNNFAIFSEDKVNDHKIIGRTLNQFFTDACYEIYSNNKITEDRGTYRIALPEDSVLVLYFVFDTEFTNTDYEKNVISIVDRLSTFDEIETKHVNAWKAIWDKCPVIILPDKEYEKTWYRSVFFLHSTAGTSKFLPGESQFALHAWDMFPFSYGGAGWSVYAFTSLGYFEEAKNMINAFNKPKSLKENAALFVPKETGHLSNDAMAFAHEMDMTGKIRHRYMGKRAWHAQHHHLGFVSGFLFKEFSYSSDTLFFKTVSYPLIKGVAEFFRSFIVWDETRNGYILPPSLSVSEDLIEISILDGVLSAKYSLSLAVKSAKILNTDPDLVEKWQAIEKKLIIPQNDTTYLEYPDDKQDRKGGGYHGIRAPVWFGFPASENIVKIDKEKAFNMLDNAWERNSGTQGMISFISNWFAISELYLNRPDQALNYLKNNIVCFDDAEISIGETGGYDRYHKPYFLTSYASYIVAPVSMLVQSYSNQINPFPAIPYGWENIEFYDLPAENGIRVSGVYKNGEIQYVEFLKNGKVDTMGKYQKSIEGTRPDEK